MAERIVEVEWEDSATIHNWHKDDDGHTPSRCRSAGFVVRDDKDAISLAESLDNSPDPKDGVVYKYGCVTTIPRSTIRKVTELTPKRRK